MKAYIKANIKYFCVALLFIATLYKFDMKSPIEFIFYFLLCHGAVEGCLYSSRMMQRGENASENIQY